MRRQFWLRPMEKVDTRFIDLLHFNSPQALKFPVTHRQPATRAGHIKAQHFMPIAVRLPNARPISS